MVYLAFTTILPLATRGTRPGTALWDVHRLRCDLGNVELRVHRRVVHVELGKLLGTLWTAVHAVSADGNAVCATALLGVLTHARWLHGRKDSMARVGR